MTPEEQAAADAAAAAKAKADADAAAKAKDPAYLEAELKKAVEARDKAKARAKELESAEAELKKLREAQMSEQEKLAARLKELEPGAARAASLEAEVQALFDEATADLTDAQKAVIVGETPEARLKHFRALKAAGLIGGKGTSDSKGTHRPGAGNGGSTITQSEFVAANETRRKALRQAVAEGKLSVVAG